MPEIVEENEDIRKSADFQANFQADFQELDKSYDSRKFSLNSLES